MTLGWWQAGALQVITRLGDADDKLNNTAELDDAV